MKKQTAIFILLTLVIIPFYKNLSLILSIPTLIAIIIYTVIYCKAIIQDEGCRPNLLTWMLWMCADIINSYTYHFVVKKDFIETLFVVEETLSAIVIFFCLLIKDKSNNIQQKSLILISFIIFFVATTRTDDKVFINLIMQSFFVVGYFFTIKGIIRNKVTEIIETCILGIIAAILSIMIILSDSQDNYVAFIYPMIVIIGDALVIYFMAKREMKAV